MNQSSLHQAAVILKSLPKLQAARILSRLEAADIRTVMRALDQVDQLTAHEITDAMNQLAAQTGQVPPASPEDSLGDFLEHLKTASVQVSSNDSNYRPFSFFMDVEPELRLRLLKDEHPRNVATVLASLPPEVSSTIVRELDSVSRVSVIRRLCDVENVSKSDQAELSYALKLRLKKMLNTNLNSTGVESTAELLSCSDPAVQEEVLVHMAQDDPELAENIEKRVFRFADIEELKDREIKSILKNADTSLWAPALKRSSLGTRQKILRNMAEPVARLLSKEISTIGPVDEHISTRAQQKIINVILRLRREQTMGIEPSQSFPKIDTKSVFEAQPSHR